MELLSNAFPDRLYFAPSLHYLCLPLHSETSPCHLNFSLREKYGLLTEKVILEEIFLISFFSSSNFRLVRATFCSKTFGTDIF